MNQYFIFFIISIMLYGFAPRECPVFCWITFFVVVYCGAGFVWSILNTKK